MGGDGRRGARRAAGLRAWCRGRGQAGGGGRAWGGRVSNPRPREGIRVIGMIWEGEAPSPRVEYGAGSQSSPVEGESKERRGDHPHPNPLPEGEGAS